LPSPFPETHYSSPTTVDAKSRISGVVNFVNGSLRPVKSDVDQELSSWYKDNSQVYVANDHACWSDPDLTRKVMKRRFGNVIRSQVNGLTPMMAEHFADVQQFILDRVAEGAHGGDTTEDETRMN
jgi:histone deacetylase 6